jgi:hypothetical protein
MCASLIDVCPIGGRRVTRKLLICLWLALLGVFVLVASASASSAVATGDPTTPTDHKMAATPSGESATTPRRKSAKSRRPACKRSKGKRSKAHPHRITKLCRKLKKHSHSKHKVVKAPVGPKVGGAVPLPLTSSLVPPLGASAPSGSENPGSGPSEAGTEGPGPSPEPPPKPTNIARPTISGFAAQGNTLTATTGAWTGSPTSFAYQWQDCNNSGTSCTDVAEEASSSYTLGAQDVGHRVLVVVEATNAGGTTAVKSSTSRKIIPATSPPPAPTNTAPPTITGTPIEGNTLNATTGSWSGSPDSYAYQWQECDASGESCLDVAGASGTSYLLLAQDVGHTLRAVVTASNAGGSANATSSPSATVAEAESSHSPTAPVDTALPAIGGTATEEGQTLSATTGTWSGSPTSYAYQWQDCNASGTSCAGISGAKSATHKLVTGDVGHTLRVVVTASNAGGSTNATSAPSATVAGVAPPPAPVNTSLPAISGTTTEKQTLSATTGTWSGSPTSYAYQWQDCDVTGTGCANVSGATTFKYRLGSGDVGHTARVIVTATNGGGSTAATSAATGVVAAAISTGCTTTISSGLQTAIENAAAGSTICLNAGNYGGVSVTTSKSSMVTITPAEGVSQSQVTLGYTDVTTSSNLTFEGMTIAGAGNGNSSAPATHIHWIGDAFTDGVCIQTPTSADIDVLVDSSTFVNISSGGCSNEGRLEVNGDNKGVSGTNGVVISNDLFQTGSPSGCTDGVNITGGASGTEIGPGDEFIGLKQGSCTAHVDPIQFYGASDTTVTGDYFRGNSDGIMSPDGNGSPMTVTNNVFDTDGEYPDQVVIGGGEHDVISHNTFGHGAKLRIGHVNVSATASNETVTDNVLTGGLELTEGQSSSGWTLEYNLAEDEALGAHSIQGKPTYAGGGSEPSTWAGWELTSTSLGHLAAGDGGDMGANYFGS